MGEFPSFRSYHDFASAIRWQRRFVRDLEQEQFLTTLVSACRDKLEELPTGTLLFRA
jgi:hypothetical protein